MQTGTSVRALPGRPKPTRTHPAVLLCIVLALALAACGPWPAPVPRPTSGPTPTRTRIPKPTRTARSSQTAKATETLNGSYTAPPANTAGPTSTPTLAFQLLSSTATPTLPFALLTPTRTPGPAPTEPTAISLETPVGPSALACKLVWQSPADGATYYTGDKFSVGWNIRNTGTVTWDPSSFEFVYLGGARLATHDDVIPMHESVPPGQEIVLSVPMKAPMTVNMYTTHWGIRQGTTYFCRLTLTIMVQ